MKVYFPKLEMFVDIGPGYPPPPRRFYGPSFSRVEIRKLPCHWCGKTREEVKGYSCQPSQRMTPDHVIPRFLGGTSARFNIVPACYECQIKRSVWTSKLANTVLSTKANSVL